MRRYQLRVGRVRRSLKAAPGAGIGARFDLRLHGAPRQAL
jgi:hypothetical protein